MEEILREIITLKIVLALVIVILIANISISYIISRDYRGRDE